MEKTVEVSDQWGGWDHNIYYNPENCGLEIVEVTEDPWADYSFHYVILWKHLKTGKLYWGEDSGCSCPSPF